MVQIKDFYSGTSVFITGGTGLLGKVLTEKLIRSCPQLKRVFLLMRPRKGLSPEQRMNEFREDKIFNKVRSVCNSALDKLYVISGDICQADMGLSELDKDTLVRHVNIVFHVAASVRFDEGMKQAAHENALGTRTVMELCREMKDLKSVVHVSTAYSNPTAEVVHEKVYQTTQVITKDSFLSVAENLPEPLMDSLSQQLLVK